MFELALRSRDESVRLEDVDFFSRLVDFVTSLDAAVQGHLSLFKLKCQTFECIYIYFFATVLFIYDGK